MNTKRRLALLVGQGVLLAACGGTTGETNPPCPAGYICVAVDAAADGGSGASPDAGDDETADGGGQCPPGYVCTPEDGGAQGTDDASDDGSADVSSPNDAAPAPDATTDAGSDSSVDASDDAARGDAQVDAGGDGGADAHTEAGTDGGPDAEVDAGLDGGADAPPDASFDGGRDAETDAGLDAATDAAPPTTGTPPSPVVVLDYEVLDARQSAALGSIVTISNTPKNALHIFNEATQVDEVVPLPTAPIVMALDPSGLNAAVAHDANVSWVDLRTGTVRATCPLSSNASGIALSASNIAYVVPATDQWVALHAVDLGDCTETVNSSTIWAGASIALHPSGLAVFTTEDLDPNSIVRCDIATSPINCTDAEDYQNWGTYGFGNKLWFGADGQRLYAASGVTLRVPSDPNAAVATYGGTLVGISSIVWMSEATAARQVAIIPGTADTTIQVNETDFLGSVQTVPIPGFPIPSTGSVAAHGHFVFTTPALDMLYVIAQADPSSGALHDYAIESFRP